MSKTEYRMGPLSADELEVIHRGFDRYSRQMEAPQYDKERMCWVHRTDEGSLIAVVTADALWDWLYIDELWVDENYRKRGLGKTLMQEAENHARSKRLIGLWLWTQSWQAEAFYRKLGFKEFARFSDFPRGHSRIGLRKVL